MPLREGIAALRGQAQTAHRWSKARSAYGCGSSLSLLIVWTLRVSLYARTLAHLGLTTPEGKLQTDRALMTPSTRKAGAERRRDPVDLAKAHRACRQMCPPVKANPYHATVRAGEIGRGATRSADHDRLELEYHSNLEWVGNVGDENGMRVAKDLRDRPPLARTHPCGNAVRPGLPMSDGREAYDARNAEPKGHHAPESHDRIVPRKSIRQASAPSTRTGDRSGPRRFDRKIGVVQPLQGSAAH
jgi:hypothetical protein